ncbi:hypothetical protein [Candidatus Liberibacter americanus]|uniref:Uncharacterized protein n=1 Tax=Candidatus Liberibacter americanus str. Sao Paulo TaxID=1261131 RepID=U6B4U1_9HYPH|nr:hypothetical protein [Candidatus Liberibacter americanus]AHA28084.1 hypothetical protein lam_738 [Candidatus Liberibacter americanus str. Sao Paulo]EMS35950.1 hypothetical protein G653_03877 [Candidatus Liberibacter americanus PW_SP]
MEDHITLRIYEDRISSIDKKLRQYVCNNYRNIFLDEAIVLLVDAFYYEFPSVKEALCEVRKLRERKGRLNKADQNETIRQIHKIREILRYFTK